MITFRDIVRREDTDEKLDSILFRCSISDGEGVFVEAGELEQGVVDAISATVDGWGKIEQVLRRLSLAAAEAFLLERAGRSCSESLARVRAEAESVWRLGRVGAIQVKAPEGYIHYALDPVGYADAAMRYRVASGARTSARATVIGIRSIGTSLSAIVAHVLSAESSVTVRPRGRTGERRIVASRELLRMLACQIAEGGDFLIVDEGPGATGETFLATINWLRSLGIDESRIVLFTSHRGLPSLADAEVRASLNRLRRFSPSNHDARIERIAETFGLDDLQDIGRGQWRGEFPESSVIPAVTGHERIKYIARDVHGSRHLIRYAGLGAVGIEGALRAHRLATFGLGPEVIGFDLGFLVLRWVDGVPIDTTETGAPDLQRDAIHYVTSRAGLFLTGETVDPAAIIEMLRANAAEALGPAVPGLAAAIRNLEQLPPAEASIADARLAPREWIRSATGLTKVDAIDHGNDIRYPGPVDPAWDVAGLAIEFNLDSAALAGAIEICARRTGRHTRNFADAVRAYRRAYAASCLGEAILALRESRGGADQRPLRREAARYRRILRTELDAFA